MLEFEADYSFINSNRLLLFIFLMLLFMFLPYFLLFETPLWFFLFVIFYFLLGTGLLFFLKSKIPKTSFSLEEYDLHIKSEKEEIKLPYDSIIGAREVSFYFNFEAESNAKKVFGKKVTFNKLGVTTIPNIIVYVINFDTQERRLFFMSLKNPKEFIVKVNSLIPEKKLKNKA